jgi:hypothetical protein
LVGSRRQELLDRLRVAFDTLTDATRDEAACVFMTAADEAQLRMAADAVLRAILSIRNRGGEPAQGRPSPPT